MKDFNKIMLIGRLGADPEKRTTNSGQSVVRFSLATSRRVKERQEQADDGTPEEANAPESDVGTEQYGQETQWHRVVAWGKQGDICAQYLKKGQSVFVEGSLRSRKFNGKDGVPRTLFEVHAQNVSFLGTAAAAHASAVAH